MAYRVLDEVGPPADWGSLLGRILVFWDTIGDPDFDPGIGGRDDLLEDRSKLEFVREQLTDAQRAELDQVDKHWKANAKAFNEDFKMFHGARARREAMDGLVEGEDGKVPSIPEAHWWWWPLEGKAA